MDSSDSPQKQTTTDTVPPAESWKEHEHVTDLTQLEAQRFVDHLGSPGLAKMAIEVVELSLVSTANSTDPNQPNMAMPNAQYLESLEAFENRLATPTTSLGLTEWVTAAKCDCEQVGCLLNDAIKRHQSYYDKIAMMERLRANDEQLLAEHLNVATRLQELATRAERVREETEEQEMVTELERDLRDGIRRFLELVDAARKQEIAIVECQTLS